MIAIRFKPGIASLQQLDSLCPRGSSERKRYAGEIAARARQGFHNFPSTGSPLKPKTTGIVAPARTTG
jgi:hypothetical protein